MKGTKASRNWDGDRVASRYLSRDAFRLGRDEIIWPGDHTGMGILFREKHTDSKRRRPCSSKATPSGERPLQAPHGFSGVSWCVGSKECNELRRFGQASAPDDSKRKRYRRLKFANQNKLQFFARIFARRYTAPEQCARKNSMPFSNTTCTPPLHHLYTTFVSVFYGLPAPWAPYTTFTPPLHHFYTTFTPLLRHFCPCILRVASTLRRQSLKFCKTM